MNFSPNFPLLYENHHQKPPRKKKKKRLLDLQLLVHHLNGTLTSLPIHQQIYSHFTWAVGEIGGVGGGEHGWKDVLIYGSNFWFSGTKKRKSDLGWNQHESNLVTALGWHSIFIYIMVCNGLKPPINSFKIQCAGSGPVLSSPHPLKCDGVIVPIEAAGISPQQLAI